MALNEQGPGSVFKQAKLRGGHHAIFQDWFVVCKNFRRTEGGSGEGAGLWRWAGLSPSPTVAQYLCLFWLGGGLVIFENR